MDMKGSRRLCARSDLMDIGRSEEVRCGGSVAENVSDRMYRKVLKCFEAVRGMYEEHTIKRFHQLKGTGRDG